VSGGEIRLDRTAAFGLIEYDDPTELAPTTTVPFAFTTQRLAVRFAASTVADLSATVQLMVNRLFGARLTRLDTVTGNSLTLTGSYQRQDAVPGYAFALTRPASYLVDHSVLDSIEVLGVAVRTVRGSATDSTATVEFGLAGNLRFTALPHFDLFSYGPQPGAPTPDQQPVDGYLRFADLVVTMTFPVTRPAEQAFAVDEGRIRIDPASSRRRAGSLAAAFPVEVTGVVAVPAPSDPVGAAGGGQRPPDLGYVSVLAPLDQVPLSPPWFGLAMRLDLGTLGPLADSAGLTATILAGWAPGTGEGAEPVYCGLQLASAQATGVEWPVQGVLRLGFRGFEFLVDESGGEPPGGRRYLLRLRRLALSVLGVSFPPGQLDVLVFGDPTAGPDDPPQVGWYAAYEQGVTR
jgi:hypothetical protein